MLANASTGTVLARRVHAAFDSASRRRGLLGRPGLDDEAVIIAPCTAIHTIFMTFAIDVVFADRDGRITRQVAHVKPWWLAATLRVYLEEGTSPVRAARRLGVHENTIVYRVRRAEAQLGHPVAERGLELAVALRLWALAWDVE